MRFKIICKPPRPPQGSIFNRLADGTDVRIVAITDDGKEHAVTNVDSISFYVRHGELVYAKFGIFDVDLDVELPEGSIVLERKGA